MPPVSHRFLGMVPIMHGAKLHFDFRTKDLKKVRNTMTEPRRKKEISQRL